MTSPQSPSSSADVSVISTNVSTLLADDAKKTFPVTFWSEVQATATITGASTDVSLPSVVLPNLTIGTIVDVRCVLKYRKIDNPYAGTNAVNGAADVQVKENAAGAYIDAIDIIDNSMQCDASAESGGDVVMGDIDVKAQVAAMNKTYDFKFDEVAADQNNLVLYDVQTGIQVWFQV